MYAFFRRGSTNFYVYCNAGPINLIDPTGESVKGNNLIGSTMGGATDAAAEGMRWPSSDLKTDGFKPGRAAFNGGNASDIGYPVAVE